MCKFLSSQQEINNHYLDDGYPEFCLVGRSNVGKSSLINALAKKKIAKISKTPGMTTLINFYDFKKYRLIDLPGYGFARVSKEVKRNFCDYISQTLNERRNLFGVLQILDLGVITKQDIEISRLISKKFVNHFIIFNKCDKYSKTYWNNNKMKILKMFNKQDEKGFVVISAKQYINIVSISKLIEGLVKKYG